MNNHTLPFDELRAIENDRQHPILLLAIDKLDMSYLPYVYDSLRVLGKVEALDVLLYGKGGEINAAKRIALLLRQFANNLTFIVPFHCQSACTLLALSGNSIIASDTALFSPVDPSLSSFTAGEAMPDTINSEDIRLLSDAAQQWFNASADKVSEVVLPCVLQSLFPTALTALYRAEQEQFLITEMLLGMSGRFSNKETLLAVTKTLIQGYPSHNYSLSAEELIPLDLPIVKQADISLLAWPVAQFLNQTLGSRAMQNIEDSLIDAIIGTCSTLFVRERITHVPAPKWTEHKTCG